MAKCHRNDDVLLHRSTGSFRLWSAASFRRKIIHTMRCGGGGCGAAATSSVEKPKQKECSRSELNKNGGSEKLSELLRLSESSSSNDKEEEEEEEVKKKVKVLEEMKRVVKTLQSDDDDVLCGAKAVRRLTKESSEARKTLALLGAIPTLMSLLDSEDIESQIASLYALLNLGIGNDA